MLALGSEIGQTDFDMYATGTMPEMPGMIRVDISDAALAARPLALGIVGDAGGVAERLVARVAARAGDGAARAAATRAAAHAEIGAGMRAQVAILEAMQAAVPGAFIVGDSTQPVYAGNLWYDHDLAGGWFNAATGYGALGYGIPAAIGAAIGRPDRPVICLTGDGGAQFALAEMMVAVQEKLPVTFVIWNNRGYREIAEAMAGAGAPVIGCDPVPPDFGQLAGAFGMGHVAVAADPSAVARALGGGGGAPRIVEIVVE